MSLARVHTWIAGEVLTASDLNSEFNNIITNASSLFSPFTADVSVAGFKLYFDAANSFYMIAGTKSVSLVGASFNTAKISVASTTTPDIWGVAGNLIDYTGTTTATGFAAAPQAGASRTLICAGAAPFTASANLIIPGVPTGTTWTATANDRVDVFAFSTTQFFLSVPAKGLQLLSSAVASTTATLDFTSVYINSTYDEYELHVVDLVPVTNATSLLLRASQGGVFDSGGTSYAYTAIAYSDGGAVTASGSTATSGIVLAGNCSTEATRSVNCVVKIYKPTGAAHRKAFGFTSNYEADTVEVTVFTGSGTFRNGVAAIDGVRLIMSSGSITSGAAYLYGVRKS